MTVRRDSPIHRLKPLFKCLDSRSAIARITPILWITLISSVAFLWQLGRMGLVDETEPLFAEAARQMTVTGDWLTPYFNGEPRFDKPPLIYWLMAIAYHIFGVNALAARLPSALAAIALTALGFYTLRRFGFPNPAAAQGIEADEALLFETQVQLRLSAWIGSAAIALNVQTIAWGRTGVSDMLLTGCMGSALLAFFCGYAQPNRPRRQMGWYGAFYTLLALAVLAKGPVGVVLPGLIIGTFLLYVGNFWVVLREIQLLLGSFIFLVITLPWYGLIIRVHGQTYIQDFFGYHNIERFTQVVNRHSAPWYFYFLVVLVGFIPWSIYIPLAIARIRFWQRADWQQQPRSGQLGLFALTWFVVIFVFFTISVTKLPSYTIPLLPAAAILVALLWSRQMTSSSRHPGLFISSVANVGFLVFLAGAVVYSVNWMGDDPAMPDLPMVIQHSRILMLGGLAWAGSALIELFLLWRRQESWFWASNLIGFVAFLMLTLVPAFGLVDEQRQLPLRQLADEIVRVRQPSEEVVMVGFKKPSLVFYTEQPITYIYSPREAIAHLQDLQSTSQSGDADSALMIGDIATLQESRLKSRQYEVIDEAGIYRLIRIKLNRLRIKKRPAL